MKQAIQWDAILEEYKDSGLTRKEFCKIRKLSYGKFKYRWYKQVAFATASTLTIKSHAFEAFTVTTPLPVPAKLVDKGLESVIHFLNSTRCDTGRRGDKLKALSYKEHSFILKNVVARIHHRSELIGVPLIFDLKIAFTLAEATQLGVEAALRLFLFFCYSRKALFVQSQAAEVVVL